jgi:hypothetical protein
MEAVEVWICVLLTSAIKFNYLGRFTFQPLYASGKSPRYTVQKGFGGPTSGPDSVEKKKKFCSHRKSN